MLPANAIIESPTSRELHALQTLVNETVSTAVAVGEAKEQYLSWEVHAWTSESRFVRRAHLRIHYRHALWQQSDWILDWPRSGGAVH